VAGQEYAMGEEKKIIIDEDWKSQVQAEKEQAAKGKQPTEQAAESAANESADPPMPPATFELLLTTLATEVLVALGQVPHPATGQAEPRRNQAKYLIDTIEVLKEKTRGNLTADEDQLTENILHQLRMIFVATAPETK
jgi:hypothetical protein